MTHGNSENVEVVSAVDHLTGVQRHGSNITFIAVPPKNVSNTSGAASIPKLWVISSAAGSPCLTSASSSRLTAGA